MASIVDLRVFWQLGSIAITHVLYIIRVFELNKYLLLLLLQTFHDAIVSEDMSLLV